MLNRVPTLIEQGELSTLYTLYREELAKLRGESADSVEKPAQEQSLNREDYLVAGDDQPALQSEVFLNFAERGNGTKDFKHDLSKYLEAKRKGYEQVWIVLPRESCEKGDLSSFELHCDGEPYVAPGDYYTAVQYSGEAVASMQLRSILGSYFLGKGGFNLSQSFGEKKQMDSKRIIEGIVSAHLNEKSDGRVKEFKFDLDDKGTKGSNCDQVHFDQATQTISYQFCGDDLSFRVGPTRGNGAIYGPTIQAIFQTEKMREFCSKNPELVFDLIFPDNRFKEVLEKIADGSLYLHGLDPEELWLMIANPKPLDKSGNGEESSQGRHIDWARYPEVAKLLNVQVYRESFKKRALEVSSLHPDLEDERAKNTFEVVLTGLKEIDESIFLKKWAIRLYHLLSDSEARRLEKYPPMRALYFKEKMEAKGEAPLSIQQLHQTLLDIEEMMKIAKDMNELGSDDPEWKSKAEEIEALYKACIKVLPSILREIELQLRHPEIQIALSSFGQLVNEIALNPIHASIASEVEGDVRQISDQQKAGREVARLTDRKTRD